MAIEIGNIIKGSRVVRRAPSKNDQGYWWTACTVCSAEREIRSNLLRNEKFKRCCPESAVFAPPAPGTPAPTPAPAPTDLAQLQAAHEALKAEFHEFRVTALDLIEQAEARSMPLSLLSALTRRLNKLEGNPTVADDIAEAEEQAQIKQARRAEDQQRRWNDKQAAQQAHEAQTKKDWFIINAAAALPFEARTPEIGEDLKKALHRIGSHSVTNQHDAFAHNTLMEELAPYQAIANSWTTAPETV